ncbi:DNA sulfur modification protein DndB [Paenibacillus sp. NRS-1775]|uniref:DNA sulfur modification protein DndB n=1 Tax=unclassified Paenibacillus TaxID=185978 RepID=UPI003D2C4DA6
MEIDRTELEKLLVSKIQTIKGKPKVVNEVVDELSNREVPYGTFNEVSRGDIDLETIDTSFLAVLTSALYVVLKDEDLNPEKFFSKKEIRESEQTIKEIFKKNNLELPITLNDVIYLDEQTYITKVSSSMLVAMYHANIIEYNFETQRSAKYKEGRSGVVPVPDVNKKSVDDIARHVLNQSYLPDMMTLNVYSYEDTPINYDSINNRLTINDKSIVSILDGFHRLQGFVKAHITNPEIEMEMILSIRVYDTDTAKRYFGQINTVNVVKKERIEELKAEKFSDQVVKDLQKNQKSELRGNKIASSPRISEIAGQLTTFSILSYAVEHTFNPSNFREYKNTAEYLIEFYGYLLSYYYDEFLGNPNAHRNKYLNHPLMFLGYTQIAKQFYDERRDVSEVNEVVEQINFKDPFLIDLLNDKKAYYASKKAKDRVLEYFKPKQEVSNND